MDCIVVYGLGSDFKHRDSMPVAEAFCRIRDHWFVGYAFVDVYYNHLLVYTTQGAAGSRYICNDCPYKTEKGEHK